MSGSDPVAELLPTFFVIGASKAGTTSVQYYMDAHPQVEMTEPKEPHLLIGPGWRDRAKEYPRLFRGDAPIRGEASTGYAVYPNNPDAPQNIAELVPDARIIYLVRDPVERTVAQYAQHVILGMEDRAMEEALDPDDPGCEYVNASRYGANLEAYLGHFERGQILVLDNRRLRAERRAAIRDLYAHVGADASFWDPAKLERDYNVRAEDNLMLPGRLKRARYSRVNDWSKRWLPEGMRARLVNLIRGGVGSTVEPEPSAEVRARLRAALAPEAERLRELTGMELAGWEV